MEAKCGKCERITVHNKRGGKQKDQPARCAVCGGGAPPKRKFVIGFSTGSGFKMSVNQDTKRVVCWWRDGSSVTEVVLDSKGMAASKQTLQYDSVGKAKAFMGSAKA